jgi:TonB family protein
LSPASAPASAPLTVVRIVDLPNPLLSARGAPALKHIRLKLPGVVLPAIAISFPPELPRITSPLAASAQSASPEAAHGNARLRGGSFIGTGTGGRRILKQVSPDFYSLPSGQRGTAIVSALVGQNGHVESIKMLESSGSGPLDQAVVHAVRQWQFEPMATESWVPLRFNCCIRLGAVFRGKLSILTFDELLADQLRTWALPSDTGRVMPGDQQAVGKLIVRIQSELQAQEKGFGGMPVDLLATWGKVQSVQFLTAESRGLAFDTASGQLIDGRAAAQLRWELYDIRQAKGRFVWLAGINRRGTIAVLEGMACVTSCLDLHAAMLPTVAGQSPAGQAIR